ncbi:hypothetical protein J3R82DRAFT_4657 [Butyriboletus roseoflavus]|nr:hypothetical protein J3R82DRAFT_4657 [Butyriboletus roseoflavus]
MWGHFDVNSRADDTRAPPHYIQPPMVRFEGQTMSKIDKGEISEELLRNIPGNAPIEAKKLVQRWLHAFANGGFGMRTTQHLELVEISIVPNVDEPARQEARVVLEMTVTEGL